MWLLGVVLCRVDMLNIHHAVTMNWDRINHLLLGEWGGYARMIDSDFGCAWTHQTQDARKRKGKDKAGHNIPCEITTK